jgi:hypothetical protein
LVTGLLDQICFLTDHPGFFSLPDENPGMPPLVENKAVMVYFHPCYRIGILNLHPGKKPYKICAKKLLRTSLNLLDV